jgi:hypothetical protein
MDAAVAADLGEDGSMPMTPHDAGVVDLRAIASPDLSSRPVDMTSDLSSRPVDMWCIPKTCAQQFLNCGIASDGCGGTIDCGGCPDAGCPPIVCGGGGAPNVCGSPACTCLNCARSGFNCGVIGDGCGGLMNCGTCPQGQTCGGGDGGMANVCR